MGKVSLVLVVKLERRREEMVDLHRVDWIMEGVGSVSEMGWLNWLLGLLHLLCSAIVVELSVTTGMAPRERNEVALVWFGLVWFGGRELF